MFKKLKQNNSPWLYKISAFPSHTVSYIHTVREMALGKPPRSHSSVTSAVRFCFPCLLWVYSRGLTASDVCLSVCLPGHNVPLGAMSCICCAVPSLHLRLLCPTMQVGVFSAGGKGRLFAIESKGGDLVNIKYLQLQTVKVNMPHVCSEV